MLTMLILTGYLWADSADAAEGAFFVTGTVEYQLDSLTDPLIRTGCHMSGPTRICTGKNPLAEFKIGYEFAFGDWRNHWWIPVFQTGWKHESHWFQGQPFNDEPETHAEKLFLEFRFGGLR
jgi:hypothetical protein